MKKMLSILIIIALILSCKVSKLHSFQSLKDLNEPTGTIRISDNLYFDKTEITNLNWLEYLYWIQNIYGENSSEYKRALPDTNAWSKLNINYSIFNTIYLKHSEYRDFPVVGISFEQANHFSKWRSDRVMEFQLIKEGLITYNPTPVKDSIFTIEKYFNGQYQSKESNKNILFYPEYTLPDSSTYFNVALFADSLNSKNYKSCKDKYCSDKLLIYCNCLESKPFITDSLPYGPNPTLRTSCSFCKKELITHLKGNVREMTNIKGLFYGISFIDSCKSNYNECRSDTSLINSFTGFRNICRYRKWNSN